MIFILFSVSVFCTEVFASNYNILKQDYFDTNDVENIFAEYVKTYEKDYNRYEYKKRLAIFSETLSKLNSWNNERPGKYSLNKFSDLTFEEFSQQYLGGFGGNISVQAIDASAYDVGGRAEIPEQFDWRNIESQYAIKHKVKAISLSEQQGLDCGKADCNTGGWMHEVFDVLAEQGGSMREEDYPYEENKMMCRTQRDKIAVKVNPTQIKGGIDEELMKNMLYLVGPLSMGMEFTDKMKSGTPGEIMVPTDCFAHMNHAVLIIGYGRENDVDYWIVKNSWGDDWGDKGFFRLKRGTGECDIGKYITVADVE